MEAPFGFVTLSEAVDTVGNALFGVNWEYAIPLNPETDDRSAYERVIAMIAEGCEAGRIEAGYPTVHCTVDQLNRNEWQKPHWRNYFDTGMIELILPLLDEKWRPIPDGRTARCPRDIFIRRDSLNRFINELNPPAITRDKEPLRAAPEKEIRVEIRAVYRDAGNDPPNIKDLCKIVQPRLNARGLKASHRQIMEVGQQQEFKGLRRQPGKTKASERSK